MPSVSYLPAQADLLAASRLHHRSSLLSWRVGVFLVAYAALAFAVVRFTGGPADAAFLLAGAAGVLFVALMALAHLIRPRLIARRQFTEQRNLRDLYTLQWSSIGYAVRGPTISSELPWGDYVLWRENADVILLYLSRFMYQLVPKRLLPTGAADEIRAWLKAAGVRKA